VAIVQVSSLSTIIVHDRIILNYKGIPHKTEWVEFLDIAMVAQHIGAPHTFLRHSRQLPYTVPILHDPATDRSLAGSLQVALNPERLHPHCPKLFPPSTEDSIIDFDNKFLHTVAVTVALLLLSQISAQLCRERSKDHFCTTPEYMYRTSLKSLSVPCAATIACWATVHEVLELFARDADVHRMLDTFLLGEWETYANVVAACWLG
jgi:hypothetical protein